MDKSFERQLNEYLWNPNEWRQEHINKPFLTIFDNSACLYYIGEADLNKHMVLETRSIEHIRERHPNEFNRIGDIESFLLNAELGIQSKKYDNTKLIIKHIDGVPWLVSCRLDKNINFYRVNSINSFYQRNNFSKFLESSYYLNKEIYCNRNTKALLRTYEGLRLPKEVTRAFDEVDYNKTFKRSQTKVFESIKQEFLKRNDVFEFQELHFIPGKKCTEEEKNSLIVKYDNKKEYLAIRPKENTAYEDFYKIADKNYDMFYCLERNDAFLPIGSNGNLTGLLASSFKSDSNLEDWLNPEIAEYVNQLTNLEFLSEPNNLGSPGGWSPPILTEEKDKDKNHETQKISHIPDDQELSVEEINAYLEEYGMNYAVKEKTLTFKISAIKGHLATFINKEDVKKYLEKSFNNFRSFTFGPHDDEFVQQAFFKQLDLLENAIFDFDEKFDKCMAEFHAKQDKDYKNPQRNAVNDSESVGKGAVSRPVKKKI